MAQIIVVAIALVFIVWALRRRRPRPEDSLAFLERHWWAGQRDWKLTRRGMHQ